MAQSITTTKRLTASLSVLEGQGSKMMDATEVYVLCDSRSANIAMRFLNACLPSRRQLAEEYPFPEFVDDPVQTFQTPEDLMQRLEQDENESYSIYWDAENADGPRQAMLFYTEDGAMIAGVGGPESSLDKTIAFIAEQVRGRFGFVTSGSCPPETVDEFKRICGESTLVNLYEWQLRNSPPA